MAFQICFTELQISFAMILRVKMELRGILAELQSGYKELLSNLVEF